MTWEVFLLAILIAAPLEVLVLMGMVELVDLALHKLGRSL